MNALHLSTILTHKVYLDTHFTNHAICLLFTLLHTGCLCLNLTPHWGCSVWISPLTGGALSESQVTAVVKDKEAISWLNVAFWSSYLVDVVHCRNHSTASGYCITGVTILILGSLVLVSVLILGSVVLESQYLFWVLEYLVNAWLCTGLVCLLLLCIVL